ALALLAAEFHVGEKLHLYRDGAVTLASLAASAGDVEGEMAGGEAPLLRFGLRGEELADGVERLDVGDRVGARRAPDRRLVDEDHVVDERATLDAVEAAVGCGDGAGLLLLGGERGV